MVLCALWERGPSSILGIQFRLNECVLMLPSSNNPTFISELNWYIVWYDSFVKLSLRKSRIYVEQVGRITILLIVLDCRKVP